MAPNQSTAPHRPDVLVADLLTEVLDAQQSAQDDLKAANDEEKRLAHELAALRSDTTTDPDDLAEKLSHKEAAIGVARRRVEGAGNRARTAAFAVKTAERQAFASKPITDRRRELILADPADGTAELAAQIRELIFEFSSKRRLVRRSIVAERQIAERKPISSWSGGYVPVNVEQDFGVLLEQMVNRLSTYRYSDTVAKTITRQEGYRNLEGFADLTADQFTRTVRDEIAGKLGPKERREWLGLDK